MESAPPGIALTQRIYELRGEGHTMPEVARRLHAEGYDLPVADRRRGPRGGEHRSGPTGPGS